MHNSLITACPIKGQVRVSCATACPLTCNGPLFDACSPTCIKDGCECPKGTVIDEAINKCVVPSECIQGNCICVLIN